jgi:glycerol uptake facilitator-like aquaporin
MATLKQNLTAEFLGSMFLVIVAIGSTILPVEVFHVDTGVAVFMNAMAVAMVLYALIETFGPISGAHFNPAVTLSLFLTKDISARKATMYVLVQIIGGMVGLLITHLMFWDVNDTLLTISENSKTPSLYFAEFIGTFALMAVIYGCVRAGSKNTPLAVAFIVGGLLITTSSTMYANPVVTLARVFTYAMGGITPGDAVIFMMAEIIGAIVAAAVIGRLLYPKKLDSVCTPYNCPPKLIELK